MNWVRMGEHGPPVVLLHGFANSAAWWMPWALPLSRHYRLLLPDLPGHGDSRDLPPPGEDILAEIGDGIASFLAAERLSGVRLVGFSFGAFVGQHLLIHHPELPITSFLNIEHPPCTTDPAIGMSADVLSRFGEVCSLVGDDRELPRRKVAEVPKAIADSYLNAIVRIAEKSLSSEAATWLLEQVRGTGPVRRWILAQVSWPWGYRIIRAYWQGQYDFRRMLPQIRVPVWAVGTREASLFAGDPLPALQKGIECSRLIYFDGSSHAFLYRHPLQFHSLLREFLSA